MGKVAEMGGDPTYWQLRPRAPAPGTELGSLADVPDGAGREYIFGRGPSAFSMFVVRRGDRVWGYLNICPHFSLKLNYRANSFTSENGSRIRCTMHFAEFQIEDGLCVAGACEGSFLDPIPLRVVDGQMILGDEPDT